MMLPGAGGALEPAGPFTRVKLTDPVYVGLGGCAHDDKGLEKANFSDVRLPARTVDPAPSPPLHCALEAVPIASKDRKVVYHTTNHIEAPNWSRDGEFLFFNSGGRIYRLPAQGGYPRVVDTGFANRCNNDHGISPDGAQLVMKQYCHIGVAVDTPQGLVVPVIRDVDRKSRADELGCLFLSPVDPIVALTKDIRLEGNEKPQRVKVLLAV